MITASSATPSLVRHWRTLDSPALSSVWQDARASVDAFRAATRQHGSLIQSWVRGQAMDADVHYPPDDVIDTDSGSQYFYHAHRHGDREHGHLHLFWHARRDGRRWRHPTRRSPSAGATHLLALSFDARGLPIGLFTVNHWVTGGAWFDAARTLAMLERFAPAPSGDLAATHRWMAAFLRLYRPAIDALLRARDRRLARRTSLAGALDDRRLEVLSHLGVDWLADVTALETRMDAR